jgi:hypothetical protein
MQITCLKCKKVYKVDPNKIPSGITSTKCRACGTSIPLPKRAPQKPTPRPAQAPASPKSGFIKIICQYCSKQYNINPNAVPEGVTSTKCKSCGHTISLNTQAATPVKPNPLKSAPQNTGTKEIACLFCGKKYNINPAKIPAGMTTTKCKACGRTMSLVEGQGSVSANKNDSDQKVILLQQKDNRSKPKQPAADIPIVPEIGRPTTPIFRKTWALAAAAGIIIVLLAGYLLKTDWAQTTASHIGLHKVIAKKPAAKKTEPGMSSTTAAEATEPARSLAEPFLALNLNVPLLMEAIEQTLPEDKKDIKYQMTAGIFKSFGFGKIQLYLYPDPEHTVLPVILATGRDGKSLERHFNSKNSFIQFLKRDMDGSYRINENAIPENTRNKFPIHRYRIQFVDNTAVFAPQKLSQLFKKTPKTVRKTRVAQMVASIARPRDLAVLSVKIPENFSTDWQNKIQRNPALQQNPQAVMVAAMSGGMLTELSESLKSVESLVIGLGLDESNGRVLHYAQQFRKGVDGKRIYQQLQSGNRDDLNVDGMVLKLISLLKDPRYQHRIAYKNNRLALEFNWEEQYDNAFLTSLSEAIFGPLLVQSTKLTPSKGPIIAQYEPPPRISPAVNIDKLKKTIPAAVQQSLFAGNYASFDGQPRMTLDLDPIEVPNASLAQLTYEVLEVVAADGTNVLRAAHEELKSKINPGSISPGYIDVNVKRGTPKESLKTAKIQFQLSLPISLTKINFVSGNAPGSVRESNGVWVKLGRLEKDVATVTYGGGKSARLFAFDKTGQALASKVSMHSPSSAATRFQGEIQTLVVVVVEEMFDYSFEVDVDLNRIKRLALSQKAE